MVGAGTSGRDDNQEVDLGCQGFGAGKVGKTGGRFFRTRGVGDRHAKTLAALCNRLPDAAQTHNAEPRT